MTKQHHSQREITEFLKENGIYGETEKYVAGKRIDFAIPVYWGYIFLEVDEKQHKTNNYYRGDVARMEHLNKITPYDILWVRFNPNSYERDGHVYEYITRSRKFKLLKLIRECQMMKPESGQKCFYFCYDSTNNIPHTKSMKQSTLVY